MATLLICDPVKSLEQTLTPLLNQRGYEIAFFHDAKTAAQAVKKTSYDLFLISSEQESTMQGMDLIDRIQEAKADAKILLMATLPTTEEAIKSMRRGVADYIQKPLRMSELIEKLNGLNSNK
jgi:DNA-binding NtrC family response regulator